MESFLTQHTGWGVRALQDIKKGSFIIEYTGTSSEAVIQHPSIWCLTRPALPAPCPVQPWSASVGQQHLQVPTRTQQHHVQPLAHLHFISSDPVNCEGTVGPIRASDSSKMSQRQGSNVLHSLLGAVAHTHSVALPLAPRHYLRHSSLTGEIITTQESAARMHAAALSGMRDFYIMELKPGLVIDARNKVLPFPMRTGHERRGSTRCEDLGCPCLLHPSSAGVGCSCTAIMGCGTWVLCLWPLASPYPIAAEAAGMTGAGAARKSR